jgi:AcrR family transcriptional regulator
MRLTREERREQTRSDLLKAAATVFARRGYTGASVDEIAAEAGFSSGALYSNFKGKEDLFLALFEEQIRDFGSELTEAVIGETVDARVEGGAERWMDLLKRDPGMFLLFVEFWAYAVRNPEVRERLAPRYEAARRVVAELIERSAAELGVGVAMPAAELAVAVDALADGLALQRLIDPSAVPDDLFARVLRLLFAAATAPAAGS